MVPQLMQQCGLDPYRSSNVVPMFLSSQGRWRFDRKRYVPMFLSFQGQCSSFDRSLSFEFECMGVLRPVGI